MNHIILSDIHANYLALQAVLSMVDEHYAGQDITFVFLGDLLGYGPLEGALACVEWFHQNHKNLFALPGNHDEWVATSMGQISKFSNAAQLSLLAQRAYLEQHGKADWFFKTVQDFVQQPDGMQIREKQLGNTQLFFTHGDVSQKLWRIHYLYPWEKSDLDTAVKNIRGMRSAQKHILFCGHTHFPMQGSLQGEKVLLQDIYYGKPQHLDDCVILNGGSVGQPRDGDPRASFLVYDDVAHTATFFRVEYPVSKLVNMLQADRNYASTNHKLSSDIREQIIRLAGNGDEAIGYKNVTKTYDGLIQRIKIGDGGSELARYQGIYERTDFGLKVLT